MRVFNIPSWYPSESNPIYGTFIKEQIALLAKINTDSDFGVATWGQGEEEHLLWSRKMSSLRKLFNGSSQPRHQERDNVTTYYDPVFSWSRKIKRGNFDGIFESCHRSYLKFAQENKVDIIHAQASYPGAALANRLSKMYDIPYVVTIRMSPFPEKQFLNGEGLSSLIETPLTESNRLIATSKSLLSRLQFFDLNNSQVINNPVDVDFFQPADRKTRDKNQLVAIGRLEHQKAFEILLRSIKIVTETRSVHLTLVGDGSEKNSLKRLIDELGINDFVRLVGEKDRKQVRDLIQESDLLVLSSRHETFGNVLVEALACGKPVVSTKCGGPDEIVSDEVGLLCKTEDEADLANSILNALDKEWDPKIIRVYALSKFSPEAFSGRIFQLYKSVI